jgi:glucose uptake protein GlcU
MKEIISALKTINNWEKLFLVLTFLSVLLKHVFHVTGTVDLFVFGMALGIFYFPLGIFFLRMPTKNAIIFPIISGFIYAIGIVSMLYKTLNLAEYELPMLVSGILLLGIIIFLFLKYKSPFYPKNYLITHFLRIGVIISINLMALL